MGRWCLSARFLPLPPTVQGSLKVLILRQFKRGKIPHGERKIMVLCDLEASGEAAGRGFGGEGGDAAQTSSALLVFCFNP